MQKFVLFLIGVLLLLSACSANRTSESLTPSLTPAVTATFTQAPLPTTQPATSTPTRLPTETSQAVRPTATKPKPSATPTPSATYTKTPAPTTSLPTATFTPVAPAATPAPAGMLCTGSSTCIPTPMPTAATLVNTENILLLGTDLRGRARRGWRTDTLLLIAIDWDKPAVGVLSIPRDFWAYQPTRDERRKINTIDQYDPSGDAGLLRETFMYNFGIRIDHFARLHRQGFVEIIDALGGVKVTLDCDLWEKAPLTDDPNEGFKYLYVPAGEHVFDGETALKFATYRYGSSDLDRARRQQVVLLSLKEQLVSTGVISQIPELWGALRENFDTDLGLVDLLRFARLALEIDMDEVHAQVLGKPALQSIRLPVSGAWVFVPNDAVGMNTVLDHLFEAPPIREEAQRSSGCPPTPSWAPYALEKIRAQGTPIPGESQ